MVLCAHMQIKIAKYTVNIVNKYFVFEEAIAS
jgi:hypothetical protein